MLVKTFSRGLIKAPKACPAAEVLLHADRSYIKHLGHANKGTCMHVLLKFL